MNPVKIVALLLAFAAPAPTFAASVAEQVQVLPMAPLDIRVADRTLRFTVEVASTVSQQARGLMFRKSLGARRGMIFPMRPPRFASFWMKNTLIPLDIIFIRPDGRVGNIAAQARPLSLDPILSAEPVGAVLELRGGLAAQLGIRPGALVTSPALR